MKNKKEEVISLINNVQDILNKVLDCKNMVFSFILKS